MIWMPNVRPLINPQLARRSDPEIQMCVDKDRSDAADLKFLDCCKLATVQINLRNIPPGIGRTPFSDGDIVASGDFQMNNRLISTFCGCVFIVARSGVACAADMAFKTPATACAGL
jgi:hypothetical protein